MGAPARVLNAEDFYADMLTASRYYFSALDCDLESQKGFAKRISVDDGGRIRHRQIVESVIPEASGAQQSVLAANGDVRDSTPARVRCPRGRAR